MKLVSRIFLVVVSLLIVSCSGGGGGSSDGSKGRSRSTGVRIVHSALDTTPLSLWVGENVIQTARYAEPTYYSSIGKGDQLLVMKRANAPDRVVRELSGTFENNGEYTLFVYGSEEENNLEAKLIADVVSQPAVGKALFQAFHGYQGTSRIALEVDGVSFAQAVYGESTGFHELAAGVHTIRIKNADSGYLGETNISFPEQGEITLLVTGSKNLGVTFLPQYNDLD